MVSKGDIHEQVAGMAGMVELSQPGMKRFPAFQCWSFCPSSKHRRQTEWQGVAACISCLGGWLVGACV